MDKIWVTHFEVNCGEDVFDTMPPCADRIKRCLYRDGMAVYAESIVMKTEYDYRKKAIRSSICCDPIVASHIEEMLERVGLGNSREDRLEEVAL